jgi:hypothetical protein
MRMMTVTLAAILVATGCVHRQPNVSVLTPLPAFFENSFSEDSFQPRYLGFEDELTEAVFKNLARSGRYQIAPSGARLLCPTNPAAGRHGYLLQAQVDTVMGDSALVTLRRNCVRPYQTIEQSEFMLLRLRRGKWQLDRVISGGIGVLAAIPRRRRLTNVAADKHFSDAASPQWL